MEVSYNAWRGILLSAVLLFIGGYVIVKAIHAWDEHAAEHMSRIAEKSIDPTQQYRKAGRTSPYQPPEGRLLLDLRIIRQDNTCCIASPKSSLQPFGSAAPPEANG